MSSSQKVRVSFIDKLTDKPLAGNLIILNEDKKIITRLQIQDSLTFFVPVNVFQLSPEVENYSVSNRDIQQEKDYRHYIYQFDHVGSIENTGKTPLNEEAFLENLEPHYEVFVAPESKMFFSSDLLITSEPDTKLYTLGEDFFDLFLIRKKASFHE